MAKYNPVRQNPDGTWKKGYTGNPTGQRSDVKFRRILHQVFTDEWLATAMLTLYMGIKPNVTNQKKILKTIQDKKLKKKYKKYLKLLDVDPDDKLIDNKISNGDRLKIIKMITERKYGKPLQKQEVEIETKKININVGLPDDLEEEDF